jgi:hypothetical protein
MILPTRPVPCNDRSLINTLKRSKEYLYSNPQSPLSPIRLSAFVVRHGVGRCVLPPVIFSCPSQFLLESFARFSWVTLPYIPKSVLPNLGFPGRRGSASFHFFDSNPNRNIIRRKHAHDVVPSRFPVDFFHRLLQHVGQQDRFLQPATRGLRGNGFRDWRLAPRHDPIYFVLR